MKSLILSKFSLTYLPIFACCLFVIIFIAMLFWVYRKESKETYSKISQLPLDEGVMYEKRK